MIKDDEAQVAIIEEDITAAVPSLRETKRSIASFDNEFSDSLALSLEDEITEIIAHEEDVVLVKEIENDENHQEFLIPTVDESPDLLDGLFVTF